MKLDQEKLKELLEAGDTSVIESYILNEALEKGDVAVAAKTNKAVKSEVDSLKDVHQKTAFETWKANNLESLIEEEVKKRNPQETPEQKRIRELEEKIQAKEKAEQRAMLKEKAFQYATEKGYDAKFATKWIDRLLAEDESTTNATLEDFKADLDGIIQAQVDAKFKENGRDIPTGGASGGASSLDIASIATAANIRK